MNQLVHSIYCYLYEISRNFIYGVICRSLELSRTEEGATKIMSSLNNSSVMYVANLLSFFPRSSIFRKHHT